MAATAAPGKAPAIVTLVGIVANVLSTTGVIISNKALLTRERFPFIITGLCMNFCATFTFLACSARAGSFTPKGMQTKDRWLLALSAVVTVLSNNASVEANSVGTYQMAKLLIVPCIIVLERLQKLPRTYTPAMYVSLVLIAIGVGLATVTDVQLNPRGCAIGFCSTILTAHYQIWQKSKQEEHALNAQQITYNAMLPQIVISLPSALLFDVAAPSFKRFLLLPPVGMLDRDEERGVLNIFTGPGGPLELGVNLILNNCLAIGINLTTYYVIGATSPVTYQVVGQLKTILVIAFGYMLFDVPMPPGSAPIRIFGMVLAISGVFWYGYLKAALSQKPKAT